MWFMEPNDANFEVMGGKPLHERGKPRGDLRDVGGLGGLLLANLCVTAFAYYLAMEIAGSRVKGEEGQKLSSLLSKQLPSGALDGEDA